MRVIDVHTAPYKKTHAEEFILASNIVVGQAKKQRQHRA